MVLSEEFQVSDAKLLEYIVNTKKNDGRPPQPEADQLANNVGSAVSSTNNLHIQSRKQSTVSADGSVGVGGENGYIGKELNTRRPNGSVSITSAKTTVGHNSITGFMGLF